MTKKLDDAIDGMMKNAKTAGAAETAKLADMAAKTQQRNAAATAHRENLIRVKPMAVAAINSLAERLRANGLHPDATNKVLPDVIAAKGASEAVDVLAHMWLALPGQHTEGNIIALAATKLTELGEHGSRQESGFGYVYYGTISRDDLKKLDNLRRSDPFVLANVTEDALSDHLAYAVTKINEMVYAKKA